jgi:hypothetical protein
MNYFLLMPVLPMKCLRRNNAAMKNSSWYPEIISAHISTTLKVRK